jgi:hypothetical protein
MLNVHRDSGDNGLHEVGSTLRRSGASKAESVKGQGGNHANAERAKRLIFLIVFGAAPSTRALQTV